MTDRPKNFSGPEVRAILDGRKTQFREVLKPQPSWQELAGPAPGMSGGFLLGFPQRHIKGQFWIWPNAREQIEAELPYQPGDVLSVRETWMPAIDAGGSDWRYRADYDDGGRSMGELQPWRPSTNMPRRASRLTLTVTGVKVERLQEISEGDAVAEGAMEYPERGSGEAIEPRPWFAFSCLWSSINAKRPGCRWADNPWVVAPTFTHQLGNIDRLQHAA